LGFLRYSEKSNLFYFKSFVDNEGLNNTINDVTFRVELEPLKRGVLPPVDGVPNDLTVSFSFKI